MRLHRGNFLDFIFPKFCGCCLESRSSPLFCSECWLFCAPIDPEGRCIHCFREIEEPTLCIECKEDPLLPIPVAYVFERSDPAYFLCQKVQQFPEAMGSFLWLQWDQLGWPVPDLILPLSGLLQTAQVFGELLGRPVLPALNSLVRDIEMIEEGLCLLVIANTLNAKEMRDVVKELAETFPKKIYALAFLS
ncbi:MAG TPA: hypothetical protein VJK48_06465 [Chlamydiales bacterium]|nr:hypothetical protein [Chlamydiales bacterium]